MALRGSIVREIVWWTESLGRRCQTMQLWLKVDSKLGLLFSAESSKSSPVTSVTWRQQMPCANYTKVSCRINVRFRPEDMTLAESPIRKICILSLALWMECNEANSLLLPGNLTHSNHAWTHELFNFNNSFCSRMERVVLNIIRYILKSSI